ncbi:MAG: protein translocase subunit SecF [Clostridia bacterium]|nr:protein translocase subunit SecF [Clostridia bacterium]
MMLKNFDFIANRKICLWISIGLLLIGLICNIVMGVELDIDFKGGTLFKYSFEGALDAAATEDFVQTKFDDADVTVDENGESGLKMIVVSLPREVDVETQTTFIDALKKQFPDNNIKELETNSLQPSYGKTFFLKCCVAIALASLFLVIYVGFRFRRIGGFSAGVMALVALLHDILIAYFVFVVFRIPLNDNFVAVVLTILGYSLNDTLVIYDRIRENRAKMDKKASIDEVVNVSLHQSFGRTLNTTICTFIAIATVAVIALIFSMDAIVSFALPMTFGVVAGFFSSTFLCTPLWALWVKQSAKRKALKAKK